VTKLDILVIDDEPHIRRVASAGLLL